MAVTREKEKLKDDIHNKEVKIKWAHNRITQEMDAHKETQEKLDKVSAIVQQSQDEAEQAKKDALASVAAFKQAHAEKMQSLGNFIMTVFFASYNKIKYFLELQVHELKAQLIVAVSNEDAHRVEQKEINELSAKIKSLEEENGTLKGKVSLNLRKN